MRCRKDGCSQPGTRFCRACGERVCRGHGYGAGLWVRCYSCTPEQMAEAIRTHHEQAREERQLRCRTCRAVMDAQRSIHGWLVHRPSCRCLVT